MSKLLTPILVAVLTGSLATPALASPFGHGLGHMSQEPVAPEAAPVPAPGPAPIAQPYPQQVGPQPYDPAAQPYQSYPVNPAPAPQMEPPHKRRKGLMIAGWTMFGSSYLLTALVGAIIADGRGICADPARCERQGYYMMVPVVGPFMAIGPSNTASGSGFLGLAGIIQTAGLVMGIVGTAQFVADGRRQQMVLNGDGFRLTRRLRMNANTTARNDGAMLGLHYRF